MRLQTANVIFSGTQDAGEAAALAKEGPAATMFSDEVYRSVLGGKPRHHEEISIFSERPKPIDPSWPICRDRSLKLQEEVEDQDQVTRDRKTFARRHWPSPHRRAVRNGAALMERKRCSATL